MRKTLVALGIALVLAGCQTTREPAVRTVTVNVPVPVKCTPDLGPEPVYADSDEALRRRPEETPLPGDSEQTANAKRSAHVIRVFPLMVAGRLQRIARDREKSAALAGCG